MAEQQSPTALWMLDSSTFIHAMIVDRVPLLIHLRSPLFFPEYVFRFELGTDAKNITRDEATDQVARKRIGVQNLTLADLDRIASLDAPRRIGIGELACAIIAERLLGGVLCDDWRAKAWLESRIIPSHWDSIESVLLDAAAKGCIGELDLVDSQRMLERHRYLCRDNLQLAHLQRQRHLLRRSATDVN